MARTKPGKRITLLSSDSPTPHGLGKEHAGEMVELWVRAPDSERLEEVQLAARLCSCRNVCLAVIEDAIE